MRDVLLVPETAQLFVSQIAKFTQTDAATAAQLEVTSREAIELAYGYTGEDRDDRKSFVYQDGMAIIPIHGTLLNRFNSRASSIRTAWRSSRSTARCSIASIRRGASSPATTSFAAR
jgi:hypothetical protein